MSPSRAAEEFWIRRAAGLRKSIAEADDALQRRKLERLAAEYELLAARVAPTESDFQRSWARWARGPMSRKQ